MSEFQNNQARWHALQHPVLAGLAMILAGTTAFTTPAQAAQNEPQAGNVVVTSGAAQWVEGNQRITPAQGAAGTTLAQHFWFYNLPGEFIQNAKPPTDTVGSIAGAPYDIAYASKAQPVMSSDWWTGAGLQWPGWVQGADPLNPVLRTPEMFNEPWNVNFIDLPNGAAIQQGRARAAHRAAGLAPVEPHGHSRRDLRHGDDRRDDRRQCAVRLWRQCAARFAHRHDRLVGHAPHRRQHAHHQHQAPWTNVKINKYTDWGVEMGYTSNGSAINFTMANGSPFVWAQRTQGNAPFVVWAGTAAFGDDNGAVSVWRNSDGILGFNVTNSFNPVGIGATTTANPAAYAIVADAGAWNETTSTDASQRQKFFLNNDATRIVVIAMPHNVPLNDPTALNNALNDLLPYAAQRITGTQLHYPPIPGSDTSVTIGGVSKPLGYDRASGVIRLKHAVTTEAFIAIATGIAGVADGLPAPSQGDDRAGQGQHFAGQRQPAEIHVALAEGRTAGVCRQQLRARADARAACCPSCPTWR